MLAEHEKVLRVDRILPNQRCHHERQLYEFISLHKSNESLDFRLRYERIANGLLAIVLLSHVAHFDFLVERRRHFVFSRFF